MTKPVITTRAGKGSALTWTEGDTNLTNLRDATITVTDGTNSKAIDLNGTIQFTGGTNVTTSVNTSTGAVTINASSSTPAVSGLSDVVITSIAANDVLKYNALTSKWVNGTAVLSVTGTSGRVTVDSSAPKAPIIDLATSGVTAGSYSLASITVDSYGRITSASNGSATTPAGSNTQLQYNNSGSFGASSSLTFDGTNLSTPYLKVTNSAGDEGGELLLAKAVTNTTLVGTGVTIDVYQNKLRFFEQGGTARGAYIDLSAASAGVGSNLLGGGSFDPASPGAIGGTTPAAITGTTITANTAFSGPHNGTVGATTPNTGAFTTLSASSTVSGTGFSTYLASPPAIGGTAAAAGTFTNLSSTGTLTFKQPIEAIYDIGTTGGTIAPNCANGSVQKITLNSALTINAFTSPVAGQSLTLFIYGGTSYTSITSTMKFAGGIKTLTATAGCIDILSIYYDGTNYFASLGKGYA